MRPAWLSRGRIADRGALRGACEVRSMRSSRNGTSPVAYGGQAVIEGVMMRGPHYFAVACRKPNGEIVLREETVPAFFTRYAWARGPFLRGRFALAHSLLLRLKALIFSSNLAPP